MTSVRAIISMGYWAFLKVQPPRGGSSHGPSDPAHVPDDMLRTFPCGDTAENGAVDNFRPFFLGTARQMPTVVALDVQGFRVHLGECLCG